MWDDAEQDWNEGPPLHPLHPLTPSHHHHQSLSVWLTFTSCLVYRRTLEPWIAPVKPGRWRPLHTKTTCPACFYTSNTESDTFHYPMRHMERDSVSNYPLRGCDGRFPNGADGWRTLAWSRRNWGTTSSFVRPLFCFLPSPVPSCRPAMIHLWIPHLHILYLVSLKVLCDDRQRTSVYQTDVICWMMTFDRRTQ